MTEEERRKQVETVPPCSLARMLNASQAGRQEGRKRSVAPMAVDEPEDNHEGNELEIGNTGDDNVPPLPAKPPAEQTGSGGDDMPSQAEMETTPGNNRDDNRDDEVDDNFSDDLSTMLLINPTPSQRTQSMRERSSSTWPGPQMGRQSSECSKRSATH
jgi:hypothetical protein